MKNLVGFAIRVENKIFAYIKEEFKYSISLNHNFVILGTPSLEKSSFDIVEEEMCVINAINNIPNIENIDFRERQKVITKGFIFDNGAFMSFDLVQEQLIKLGIIPKEIEPHYYGDTHFSQEQFFMALILPEKFTLRYKIEELFKNANEPLSDIVTILCSDIDKDLRKNYKEGLGTNYNIKIQTKTSIIKILFKVERFFEVAYPFQAGRGENITVVDIEKERIIGVAVKLDKIYSLVKEDELKETLKFKGIKVVNDYFIYSSPIKIPTHYKLVSSLRQLNIVDNSFKESDNYGYVTNFGNYVSKEEVSTSMVVQQEDLKRIELYTSWNPKE